MEFRPGQIVSWWGTLYHFIRAEPESNRCQISLVFHDVPGDDPVTTAVMSSLNYPTVAQIDFAVARITADRDKLNGLLREFASTPPGRMA